MATIQIVLRTDKARKNGECPLYIRLTIDRKSRYTSVKHSILEKQWDAGKQRVKKSHPNAAALNTILAEKKAEVEALALDLERRNKDLQEKGINEALFNGCNESFLDFAHAFVKSLDQAGRWGTAANYAISYRIFARWAKAKKGWLDVRFGQLSKDVAQEFKIYLKTERGNSHNTITSKFAALKSAMSNARDAGIVDDDFYPFKKIKLKIIRGKKSIPNRDEVSGIANFDLPADGNLYHARNLYLFCTEMAGLRFGDAVSLRWSQVEGDRLRWETEKGGKQRLVYLPQAAREILKLYDRDDKKPYDFVFPFLRGMEFSSPREIYFKARNLNATCNANIKRVCEKAECRKYTFHTSRHFFATDSLRRGMRVEVLQKLLTHATIRQTMEYAQIVSEDMDAAMKAYEQAKQS